MNDATGFDEDITIWRWTGGRWGEGCRVQLRFGSTYRVTARYGRPELVRAAEAEALRLARALNAGALTPDPDAAAVSAPSEFPVFGGKDDHNWSYVGRATAAVTLLGKRYRAAAGYEGVGWRTSTTVLIAFYTGPADRPEPEVGFVIERARGRLTSAAVVRPERPRQR